jgi:Na+-translocating ferredoxin:NAD+ oxidoreductase RnfG subunit
MRFRPSYRLLPLAALAVPMAGQATVYLTPAQAQTQMFPGQSLTPAFRDLTPAQLAAIRAAAGDSPLSPQLKAWRAQNGGWFIVDEVIGKHEFITYAVSLDPTGTVTDVEILEYREAYGGEVRQAKWLRQFVGKRPGQSLKAGSEIRTISGATLSSKHVTDGVRRLLATYAIVLAHG